MKRRALLTGGAGLAVSGAARSAHGQTSAYPNRPIRIIVPYAAGVSPDVVARLIAERLGQALGQPVVIDNRVGAGGMIGAEFAAAAPNDGYNLLFAVKGPMAIAPHLYPNAKYKPLTDFVAVTQILVVPHILTATLAAPYATLGEMVAFAKRNPGKIDYASAGAGSQPHIAMEAWARRLGIQLTHVPYRNNPSPDVMNGTVSLYVEASTTAVPSIQGGRIKALAVSGAHRIPSLPDLPTVTEFNAELDPDGVIGNSWHGVFAPAGTPDAIVAKLNAEIVKIVKLPEIQARLVSLGLTPTGTTADVLASGVASDLAYWGGLIRELGIRLE